MLQKNRRKNQTNNQAGRQTVNRVDSQADKKTDSQKDRHCTDRQQNRHTVRSTRYMTRQTLFFQSLSIPVDEAKPILIKITKPCGRLACWACVSIANCSIQTKRFLLYNPFSLNQANFHLFFSLQSPPPPDRETYYLEPERK